MTYSWAEHTSEVELHVEAESEAAVFEQALQAFAELISTGSEEARPESVSCGIALDAGDRAALLAAWLDELVFLAETEDLVPQAVERMDLTDRGLRARVLARRGGLRHVVKGVTYHRLAFERAGEAFEATAVLDV